MHVLKCVYMRGGTSKGLFFLREWLPKDPAECEALLLRALGSPDPFGNQIDGMGGATSSTSKVVIVTRSMRSDSDVDYLFGQVSVNQPMIDWSGNCGNLTAAVGPFAVSQNLVRTPMNGIAEVKIWQANIKSRILSRFAVNHGRADEEGSYWLDGVAFSGAKVELEYLEPCGAISPDQPVFPTGNVIDYVDVPTIGPVNMTMMNAANPAVFVHASTLGLSGTELPTEINSNSALLHRAEMIRASAAVAMGLATSIEDAKRNRQHTPKLAYLAKPASYTSTGGAGINREAIDINARIFSMGKLHHAMTGTGAIAIAAAAVIPGTLANLLVIKPIEQPLRIGHPAGSIAVGVEASEVEGHWFIQKATMNRTARRLMSGEIFVPGA